MNDNLPTGLNKFIYWIHSNTDISIIPGNLMHEFMENHPDVFKIPYDIFYKLEDIEEDTMFGTRFCYITEPRNDELDICIYVR